eukprot:5826140-Ditylum_brightwellii.AAC.1
MVFGLYLDQPIGTRKRKNWSKGIERQSGGMIDMLALHEDKSKWLKEYQWKGKEQLPDYVPLNDLPSGVDILFENLGSNFGLDLASNNDQLLFSIYHCEIIPVDWKPFDEHTGPTSSD